MKKKVLVLGAGMVAGPLVHYLLEKGFRVEVASRTVSKAENLVQGYPEGEAQQLNAKNTELMEDLIRESDLAVSLLPPSFHTVPAEICIDKGKPLVTTSYVSEEMEDLDGQAKESGVLLLNETGLDPGIDHMSAVKTIEEVHEKGGEIKAFRSYCGALPAPEESLNPLGYKFSWHPTGVLHASTSSARFLKEGEEIQVPSEDLFTAYEFKEIEGIGHFEQYPNRNSLPYMDKYNIPETDTIYRATLRNIGWCEALKKMVDLGLLDDEKKDLQGLSFREFTAELAGCSTDNLEQQLAEKLNLDSYSRSLKTLKWLGLTDREEIPFDEGSPMKVLANRMEEKLSQDPGERDMVILRHEFEAHYEEEEELIKATLVDYGDPKGDTSIARTVGLPAAIASRMILEGRIDMSGVYIPVEEEIYEPILEELEAVGMKFEEETESLC
ncbi:MAG: saccharopine dehydrogenase C-terminal domain-containing protein [Candidatus Bipolaricaulota bacterium]|nr:saccharopine dehydrogenase NADP-binding domain-containing protein [Candidatus Bipolaricaulota bacterium]